jgi:hypothetical protein
MDDFKKKFKYPFKFINKDYDEYLIKNIIMPMHNDKLILEKISISALKHFTKNIVDVYWYKEGIPDELPWYFVGRIKYKNTHRYVFYIGESDYTGFDCQGSMKLYVSKSFTRILNNAIPQKLYDDNKKLKEIYDSNSKKNKIK